MNIPVTKEQLYSLYWIEEYSTRDIAKIYNVGQTSVRRWLDKYDIPTRSSNEARPNANTELFLLDLTKD